MIPLSTIPTISNVSSSPATSRYLHQELHQSSCPCFNSWSITNTLSHQEFIISILPSPFFSILLLVLFHINCFIISTMICLTGLSLSTPSFVSSMFPHESSMSLPQFLVSLCLTFIICFINIPITIFLMDLTQPFAISNSSINTHISFISKNCIICDSDVSFKIFIISFILVSNINFIKIDLPSNASIANLYGSKESQSF